MLALLFRRPKQQAEKLQEKKKENAQGDRRLSFFLLQFFWLAAATRLSGGSFLFPHHARKNTGLVLWIYDE
jgi:hypothetical protein